LQKIGILCFELHEKCFDVESTERNLRETESGLNGIMLATENKEGINITANKRKLTDADVIKEQKIIYRETLSLNTLLLEFVQEEIFLSHI
jgi:hypothetical protein